jgi:REP element-mobilizing transposase RayT
MNLNSYGEIVKQELLETPGIRLEMILSEWAIMPNHVHFIVIINEYVGDIVGAHGRAPLREPRLYRKPKSISSFIPGFKSTVTKRINEARNTPGEQIWQRNFGACPERM